MALDSDALKRKLLEATDGKTDATEALSALGDTAASYIQDNAEVSFSWTAVGVGSPPPADTITSANGTISGLAFDLSPVLGITDPAPAGLHALQNAFISGLTKAEYNITDAGFTTKAASMGTSPSLSALTIGTALQGIDSRDGAYSEMAKAIVDWVILQKPVGPVAGSRVETYTGSGLVTGIS
jgi:hypothetical protein